MLSECWFFYTRQQVEPGQSLVDAALRNTAKMLCLFVGRARNCIRRVSKKPIDQARSGHMGEYSRKRNKFTGDERVGILDECR